MSKPLEYDFEDGTHVNFNKYTIDTSGIVRNIKTRQVMATHNNGGYETCHVYMDNGKRRGIRICRAMASTYRGKPPMLAHTADHKDKNTDNDTDDNIRWLDKSGQVKNRAMSDTNKSALIVVKDDIEKTAKEWVEFLRYIKNHMGREFTESMISHYAQRKYHGFAYKEYPDLQGEVWKKIQGSKNTKGHWEISNMNRVKYTTKHAENVLSGDRLSLMNTGYPKIRFDNKNWLCHIISFMTFFPEEYASKKTEEIVLHEDDDKLDFRPHKLRLGTRSQNSSDAYDNGCYDGTKSARMACASYINGVFEKEHKSQRDAAKYLKTLGYDKADMPNINNVLKGKQKTAYDRVWKKV